MPFWAVERHIGQHAGAIEKAGLGGDEQQGGGGEHGDPDEARGEGMRPAGGDLLEEDGVQRFSRMSHGAVQHIGKQQAAHHQGEGDAHVEHGALASGDAGLAENGQAV
jgi:hypothetical protein